MPALMHRALSFARLQFFGASEALNLLLLSLLLFNTITYSSIYLFFI